MILNLIEKKKTTKGKFKELRTKNILPDFEKTKTSRKCLTSSKILKNEKRKSYELR